MLNVNTRARRKRRGAATLTVTIVTAALLSAQIVAANADVDKKVDLTAINPTSPVFESHGSMSLVGVVDTDSTEQVHLWVRRNGGAWSKGARATSSSSGLFSYSTATPDDPGTYEWTATLNGAAPGTGGVESPTVQKLRVKEASIALKEIKNRKKGTKTPVRGRVRPAVKGVKVHIQYRIAKGKWKKATVKARTNRNGRFKLKMGLNANKAGRVRVKALFRMPDGEWKTSQVVAFKRS